MSKIFLSIIRVHLLMVYFFIATLNAVEAKSSTVAPLIPSHKNRNFRHSHLQNIFPVLRNQKLSDNMLSLIHNLRRENPNRRRLHRMKRKGAFVVSDLEGNPMLVLRKPKTRKHSNYLYHNQHPAGYDLQKLGLYASGPVPNFQVPTNMGPFQQVIQPLPYNVENPNSGVLRQLAYSSRVVPQSINVLSQPGSNQTNDFNAAETGNNPNDEYYDNFELIPLPAIKSRSIFEKDAPVSRSNSTIESFTTITSPSQISEPLKQAIQTETKGLDQTKGIVNVVSLLASALEQAFSVPREVVLPNGKGESTSFSSLDKATQDIASSALEQVSLTPFTSMDQVLQDVIDSSLAQPSVNTLESTSSNPMQDLISTSEQSFLFTLDATPSNIKREEIFKHESKTNDYWKDFQLGIGFSLLHKKTTSNRRNVLSETTVSLPSDKFSSTEVQDKENKHTSENINDLLQDTAKTSDDFNINEINFTRHKLHDNTSESSNIIQKILEVVENIQVQEKETKMREDLPCNITGFWSSLAGGVLLNITHCESHLNVVIGPKTPPSKTGFLLESGWKFKSFKPFCKNDIIIVNGLNEKCKRVASFIGECRICCGREIITGNWLLGRPSRNCNDQRATEKLLSDVWSRETLTERRKEKLKSLKGHSKTTAKENVREKPNKKGGTAESFL